jgi:transposase-like protein
MHDHALSAQQLDVISALSSGATMTAAAAQAGIHRNSISYWRRNHLPFEHALADAQYDKAMLFREKTEDLVELAVQAIRDILADPEAPASVRLKAALAVISAASTPPAPKKQIELQIHNIQVADPHPSRPVPANTHKNAHTAPAAKTAGTPDSPAFSAAERMHKDAQTKPPAENAPSLDFPPFSMPEFLHKTAQIRRETPKIGRNEPCPCGSGQKYKRCCLNKPQAKAA